MAQDFEQMLKELFGDSWNKFSEFQGAQSKKLMDKIHEIVREAVKEDLGRLNSEVADLRERLATLEAERARAASDSLDSSF